MSAFERQNNKEPFGQEVLHCSFLAAFQVHETASRGCSIEEYTSFTASLLECKRQYSLIQSSISLDCSISTSQTCTNGMTAPTDS